jgi:hypothetical protein
MCVCVFVHMPIYTKARGEKKGRTENEDEIQAHMLSLTHSHKHTHTHHTHTQMIEPVAERLKIPKHRIYANTVVFNADGVCVCVCVCVCLRVRESERDCVRGYVCLDGERE